MAKKIGEKMKDGLSETKRQIDKRFENLVGHRDDDGNFVIDMIVRDDTNFLSPFSESRVPVVNGDVASFVENRTKSVGTKEKLKLKIHSTCIDKTEQEIYKTAIKEYFSESCAEVDAKIKRNNIISIFLLLLGILTLSAMFVLEKYSISGIWTEVVDIVAWVFLWEATDIFVLQNMELRLKRKKLLSIIAMSVEFVQD